MNRTAAIPLTASSKDRRSTARHPLSLSARLTWKDRNGSTRFASVVTRDVSECGVYVECFSPVSLPLHRLVQIQLERESRSTDAAPASLRHGRVLATVSRLTSPSPSGRRQGLGLRLLVEPRRAVPVERGQATA